MATCYCAHAALPGGLLQPFYALVLAVSPPLLINRAPDMPRHYYQLLAAVMMSSACTAPTAVAQVGTSPSGAAAGAVRGPWQAGVLCSSTQTHSSCSSVNGLLLQKYDALLAGSTSSPTVTAKASSVTFLLLARYLKPSEANVHFAQAYCLSKGSQLAYWNSAQEYSVLSTAALKLAVDTKSVWHFYMGLVQAPGSQEAYGWLDLGPQW